MNAVDWHRVLTTVAATLMVILVVVVAAMWSWVAQLYWSLRR